MEHLLITMPNVPRPLDDLGSDVDEHELASSPLLRLFSHCLQVFFLKVVQKMKKILSVIPQSWRIFSPEVCLPSDSLGLVILSNISIWREKRYEIQKSGPAMTELEMATLDWLVSALDLPEHFKNSHSGPGCGIIQVRFGSFQG